MNASTVAAIVGLLSAIIASVVTGYVGYRRLRTELHVAVRREYMTRQIEACEEIWRHLLPLSEYSSSTSIVLSQRAPHSASPARAKAFCDDITTIFFSPAGLYISREVRYNLFALRSFLTRELIKDSDDLPDATVVSRSFVKRLRFYSGTLFKVIRSEVGAIDLRVVREGPIE